MSLLILHFLLCCGKASCCAPHGMARTRTAAKTYSETPVSQATHFRLFISGCILQSAYLRLLTSSYCLTQATYFRLLT